MKVTGKVVVVTGAGSGMGREITLELVRRGATVAAVDFRAETLKETVALATKLGGAVTPFALDVSDLAKVAALPALVAKAVGPADGLINNAGIIQPFVHVDKLDWKDVEKVMAVNFFGPVAQGLAVVYRRRKPSAGAGPKPAVKPGRQGLTSR